MTSLLPADIESCRRSIRDAGLRVTPARVAVLKAVREAERPLSHADICDILTEDVWNRTTVWRNLSDLETAGLVRRTELGDRLWRFEEAGAGSDHGAEVHPHFICTSCGEVSCLPDDAMELHLTPSLPRSVKTKNVEIQVRGVCDKCD